jgi:hypothetical protein
MESGGAIGRWDKGPLAGALMVSARPLQRGLRSVEGFS